ncbi:MAG: hypothetical protein P4N60_01460 [Verrucomicrobiae bacterium]|nr:hypothetical protein [Verrucomicrobiae bacterium]
MLDNYFHRVQSRFVKADRPPNPVDSNAMVKWTTIVSVVSIACFVPTYILWGSRSGFWLPDFLYPAPSILGEGLHALFWAHGGFLFILAMLLCQMPVYGLVLGFSWRIGHFKLGLAALLVLHVIAVVFCFWLKPLQYRAG